DITAHVGASMFEGATEPRGSVWSARSLLPLRRVSRQLALGGLRSGHSKSEMLPMVLVLVQTCPIRACEYPHYMALVECPVFIGGEWQNLNSVPTSPVFNPSLGEVIAETPLCTAPQVNAAVEAAAQAFPAWWETPPTERARVLFRFKMLLEENFEE